MSHLAKTLAFAATLLLATPALADVPNDDGDDDEGGCECGLAGKPVSNDGRALALMIGGALVFWRRRA